MICSWDCVGVFNNQNTFPEIVLQHLRRSGAHLYGEREMATAVFEQFPTPYYFVFLAIQCNYMNLNWRNQLLNNPCFWKHILVLANSERVCCRYHSCHS